MNNTGIKTMEFHISSEARDRYQFDETLFMLNGNVIFANFHAARLFAQKMNQKRDLINFPEQAIRSGQINAMGLIDEILHLVVAEYHRQRNPEAMKGALDWMEERIGDKGLNLALLQFTHMFPPIVVYRREISPEDYLAGDTGGISNRQIVLEEMLLLWLANVNPAFAPYAELFDDSNLKQTSDYLKIIQQLQVYFDTQPTFGPENQNLIDMLRSPAITVPYSLSGQLDFIRARWGYLIGKYIYRLLSSLDLIKEEDKAIFFGPGPARVYDFSGLEHEVERFSPDKDWMPHVVLIAKNTYVWLDQLSKKYRRSITRLDQIPVEELDILARWGFTGLWLIGLWERSQASKKIKQLRGNPEAVASAYSLLSYDIAADLGGEAAYQVLRDLAWERGIRLASDMVPNHMGIDSKWVIEHPDWFIALDYSPFPSYSYNGPNLSWDDRVGLYIEDHYFDNSDAAVTFKRVDFWSGDTKYIYHGNDGTSMPWNDTAQLNYLMPEVREAVIQTILHVARKFPIIRFDAAMTLAKKHFQRLWFPEPGSGGDIPSRAEYGLTKAQLDTLMPEEFWREVVDRVAREVPDTLLLAEAFWLMEGYFVRTLGMHRVYNSAFMNMLRDEKNQEYRSVIKNTIEFDPEILKRYVNFMNNPDERTAIDQFGNGDKYFGICTLLATMPGTPMFGHGQVEGYTEKYGMEYRRAYWDEYPDEYLVQRHEREIFPLLRKRYLFAEVENFLLYDLYTSEGYVNEDVYAFSNRRGDESALVVYHNKFSSSRGWIRISAAYPEKVEGSNERVLSQKSLGQGLAIHDDSQYFTIFRDLITGREYIRNSKDIHERGLYLELDAYKYFVFTEFREVQENEWSHYTQLADYLGGRSVPSIDEALKEIFLRPIHHPYRQLINPGQMQWFIDNRILEDSPSDINPVLDELEAKAIALLQQVGVYEGSSGGETVIARQIRSQLNSLLVIPNLEGCSNKPNSEKCRQAYEYLRSGNINTTSTLQTSVEGPWQDGNKKIWAVFYAWVVTSSLGKMVSEANYNLISRTWIDEWLLGKIIISALQNWGMDYPEAGKCVEIIKLLITHQDWMANQEDNQNQAYKILQSWLGDLDFQTFIGVNRHQGILWFNQESFDELLWWLFAASVINSISPLVGSRPEWEGIAADKIVKIYEVIEKIREAESVSNYQIGTLLESIRVQDKPGKN